MNPNRAQWPIQFTDIAMRVQNVRLIQKAKLVVLLVFIKKVKVIRVDMMENVQGHEPFLLGSCDAGINSLCRIN